MPRPSRTWDIRRAVLDAVLDHPKDVVSHVAASMGLSRPAVHTQVKALVDDHYLKSTGTTRPTYSLGRRRLRIRDYDLTQAAEDTIWNVDFAPLIQDLSPAVVNILQYGVTEMVNNAIDHSAGKRVKVRLVAEWNSVTVFVEDDGIGIFRKIAKHLELPDERLALLELSKGKFTTDPQRHTGEGVFFTSRMFDAFHIYSRHLHFHHSDDDNEDSLIEYDHELEKGTIISMTITRGSRRDMRKVFSAFSSGPEDYAFERTIVPVRLAKLGNENLVSRSQAKRVLARVDRFRKVEFDFAEVDTVGQAFADEIFRVFALSHPDIELRAANTAPEVARMIRRALTQDSPT